MEKKYQIFISSTYDDLKEERDQTIKAILEMGHIPVGMEMFSAGDEEQWQLIAHQIEETDYYVVLVGHRYGSETKDGVSFTEKEYDYAIQNGVPALGFIIDENTKWPPNKMEKQELKKEKLEKFKRKVKTKMVQFWSSKDDLHYKISISLLKAINRQPRIGWSRADLVVGVDITKELTRLSEENSRLRAENNRLIGPAEPPDEVKKTIQILNLNERSLLVRETKDWEGAIECKASLLEIFLAGALNMIDENSSAEFARNVALGLNGSEYYKEWPIGKNRISEIIADFVALDLIEPSKKSSKVRENNSYWSLTELGSQVLRKNRRILLEEGISTSSDRENLDKD